MASNSFVLVTGVSGFLGAHVVDQLVKDGHRVRGAVRSAKVAKSQATFDTVYGAGKVEIVAIDDLVVADFSAALKGITSIVHVASPLIGKVEAEKTLDGAIEGTVRILRQGQAAGIKSFSIVSSVVALTSPASVSGAVLTDKDWNPSTREEALDPSRDAMFVYAASKALAEKEIWKFASAHPDINITTLNPPFFVGPNAPGQYIAPGETGPLSTSLVLYNIVFPDSKLQTSPLGFVDVRDVAAGLIAGLKATGLNRVPFTGKWFDLKDAVDYLAIKRPELKGRLASIVPIDTKEALIDTSKAAALLGLKPRAWQETVLDTIDYLVQLEKDWAEQGVDVEATLKNNEWRG